MVQGLLQDFPVAEVLRCLARGRKTGVLEVCGDGMRPQHLRFEQGHLAGIREATAAPAEALALVLCRNGGSFRFRPVEPGHVKGIVHDTLVILDEAEALVAEWRRIESRLPIDAVVRPRRRDRTQDWRLEPDLLEVLGALGTGGAARLVARRLEITHLEAARRLVELIDLGLAEPEAVIDLTQMGRNIDDRIARAEALSGV